MFWISCPAKASSLLLRCPGRSSAGRDPEDAGQVAAVVLSKRQFRPRENRVFARGAGRRGKYAILAPLAEDGMSAGKGFPLSKSTAEGNSPCLQMEDAQARKAFRLTKRHRDSVHVFPPNREKDGFSAVRSAVFGRKIRREPHFSGFSCGRKKCFLGRNGNFSRQKNGRFLLKEREKPARTLKICFWKHLSPLPVRVFRRQSAMLERAFSLSFCSRKRGNGCHVVKREDGRRNKPASTGKDGNRGARRNQIRAYPNLSGSHALDEVNVPWIFFRSEKSACFGRAHRMSFNVSSI